MREIDLFGVYLPPGLADLTLAAVIFVPVKILLDRLGTDRVVWHRPLFDVSLFVCTAAGVIVLRALYLRSAA